MPAKSAFLSRNQLHKMPHDKLVDYTAKLIGHYNRRGGYLQQLYLKLRLVCNAKYERVEVKTQETMYQTLSEFLKKQRNLKAEEDSSTNEEEEESNNEKVELICNICNREFDHRKIRMIAMACGHVMCEACTASVSKIIDGAARCPFCKRAIKTVLPLFCMV